MEVQTILCPKPTSEPPENTAGSRIVRISMIDPEATDSSSSDEEAASLTRRRVKRYIREITIGTPPIGGGGRKMITKKKKNKKTAMGNVKKFRGVRRRPWGKWAAEIRDPGRRVRMWLGTYDTAEEAAMVYNRAAEKLRGSAASTNFLTPLPLTEPAIKPSSPTNLSSPTSVLQYRTHSTDFSPPFQTAATGGAAEEFPAVDFPFFDDISKSIVFEPPLLLEYETSLIQEIPWFGCDSSGGGDDGDPVPAVRGEDHDYFEEILMGSDPLVVL